MASPPRDAFPSRVFTETPAGGSPLEPIFAARLGATRASDPTVSFAILTVRAAIILGYESARELSATLRQTSCRKPVSGEAQSHAGAWLRPGSKQMDTPPPPPNCSLGVVFLILVHAVLFALGLTLACCLLTPFVLAGVPIHQRGGRQDHRGSRLEQGADVLSREGAMLYTRRCDCFSPPLKVKVGGVKGSSSRMYSHRFGYVV